MKFSEYEYKKPDYEGVAAAYGRLSVRLAAADSLDEAVACVEEHEKLLMTYATNTTIANIRHTIDTRDEFYAAEVKETAEKDPMVSNQMSLFLAALLQSRFLAELKKIYPEVVFKNAELQVKTISPAVLELLAQESSLQLEYQKLQASAKLDFRGEKMNLQQLGKYKTDPDREVRRAAFAAEGEFYTANREGFDGIFDKLVKIRTEIAHKLGFKNFVELAYCRQQRNCYDAQMVKSFRAEVKKHLVPLVAELKKDQAKRIGVDKMKFQDDTVLFKQGNPRPVGDFDDTYAAGVKMYREMRPETKEFIDFMDEHGLFSLAATEGKAAGGYCTFIFDYHSPFIFSNFNGTAGDVEVFTHEGGHAFEAYVADKNVSMVEAGNPTMESCEVHSMSMEFLAWPWLESFYGERVKDARLAHLLGTVNFIPYGCLVDDFQHVVYENPEMTPDERNEAWLRLEGEYRPFMDFDGIPGYSRGAGWQRQLHIYLYPFYYIDYCLAQSVALQIFAIMRNSGWEEAWKHYYAFLEKAGTMTFTGLLDGAGLKDPFKSGSMPTICETIKSYLAENA